MIAFVILLIVLALSAQYVLTRDSLAHVQEDFYPEETVVDPDQVFYLNLSLTNTGRRYLPFLRVSLFLQEEIQPLDQTHCTAGRAQNGSTVSYSTWLRPHQRMEFRLPVRISRRGRYVFRPMTVSGGDFLGLSEQSRQLDRFREVVIAPEEAPEKEITAALGGFLGERSANRFLYEDPVLTVGFREYTGQEPMKMISWTQSARGHGLMVKNYDYTIEPRISVLVNADTRGISCPDALEACFSLARTVCRMLEDRRIPYDLTTNAASAGGWGDPYGLLVRQGLGSVHFGQVLELLGRATHIACASAGLLLERAVGSGTVCSRILISSEAGLPDARDLTRLREASGGSLLVLTARTEPDEGANSA